ncbi:MAG: hypothetical protein P8H13_00645 [Polaribacter sp.]|nr:hypothetical protein [Polaribacter sp.]
MKTIFKHTDGNVIKNITIKDGVDVFVKDSVLENFKILTSYKKDEDLIVELINIKTNKSLKKWKPSIDEIMDSMFQCKIITGNSISLQDKIIKQVIIKHNFKYYIPSWNTGEIIVS